MKQSRLRKVFLSICITIVACIIVSKPLTLIMISLYQQHISPYKGYSCAYAKKYNDIPCSEFAKQKIQELGLIQGVVATKNRFRLCNNVSSNNTVNQISPRTIENKDDDCGACCKDPGKFISDLIEDALKEIFQEACCCAEE